MKELTEFEVGYAMACANVVNTHDEPTIASDVLLELGKTRQEILKGFDWAEYDQKAFQEIFQDYRWKAQPKTGRK